VILFSIEFSCENCWFFDVFRIAITSGSLIIIIFKKTKIDNSLVLKFKKFETTNYLKIPIIAQHYQYLY